MRIPYAVLDAVDAARALGAHQWTLRMASVAGTCVVLVSAAGAGGDLGLATVLAVLVLAVWAALRPDSIRPIVVLAVLLLLWWSRVDSTVSVWSLGAALGVLLVHGSAAYAAETAPGARPAMATHRRWASQAMVVAAVTTSAWGVARALSELDRSGDGLVIAAALGAILVTTTLLATPSRPEQSQR